MPGMENLSCRVYRIGNDIVLRIEGRIYTRRDCRIAFQVHFLDLAVMHEDCSAQCLTHMELHIVGLVVLVRMTVDALARRLCLNHHVAENYILIV